MSYQQSARSETETQYSSVASDMRSSLKPHRKLFYFQFCISDLTPSKCQYSTLQIVDTPIIQSLCNIIDI